MIVNENENLSNLSSGEQNLFTALEDIMITCDSDSSYRIKSIVKLSASMPCFSGHFPGNPIFPAVMQLAIVRLLSSHALERSLRNAMVGKTKFSGVIRPEEKTELTIELENILDRYEARFNFYNDDKLASSGVVTYI